VSVTPATPEELARFGRLVETWADRELASGSAVVAVDHDPELHRWYVRMRGEEKETFTIWLTLGQRTLHYETYFMPAPETNVETLYEYLLRLNLRAFGMHFAVGPEDAVYLVGRLPLAAVDLDALDGIAGTTYASVEQWFRPAMRIGYEGRFRG
jgi:hypothetical protein